MIITKKKSPIFYYSLRLLKLIYLVIVFHLPVWRKSYHKGKFTYLENMPTWMQSAITVRNRFEATAANKDAFYWARLGPIYIRSNHSYPGCDHFRSSRYHLFVVRKHIIKHYLGELHGIRQSS